MSNINDGGPAFPRPGLHDPQFGSVEQGTYGMSLRDWFAGHAMQAQVTTDMVPGKACDALIKASHDAGQDPLFRLALNSYKIADAMLAAREGGAS